MSVDQIGWLLAAFFLGLEIKGIIDYFKLKKHIRREMIELIDAVSVAVTGNRINESKEQRKDDDKE